MADTVLQNELCYRDVMQDPREDVYNKRERINETL